MELLESQKPSFSIFLVLKGLNKIIKNHSKPPKLTRQQLKQKPNIFLVFH